MNLEYLKHNEKFISLEIQELKEEIILLMQNILTKDTILRGKGNFVTDLDYDNIINNRLVFCGDDFIIEKTLGDLADITYSNFERQKIIIFFFFLANTQSSGFDLIK